LKRWYGSKKLNVRTGIMVEAAQTIQIFYCYAHEDTVLRNELERHLGALKRLGQITGWYDREIQAGTEWEHEIEAQLATSSIILLLLSADFISSDYCYSVEMQKALELHRTGRARVIPILLRPVDWQETPIATLQMLPTGAKPITRWANRDDALEDVARNIRVTVNTLLTSNTQQERTEKVIQEENVDSHNQLCLGCGKLLRPNTLYCPNCGAKISQENTDQAEAQSHDSLSSRRQPPNNLPADLTMLIGCQKEIEEARKYLLQSRVRLLTITGPGGGGKTRLALEVARKLVSHFDDGVFLVLLAAIRDPALVISAIAESLGIQEAGRSLVTTLNEYLRNKRLLLILDNFEQVLDAAASVVKLLVMCPRLTVIVTSRQALDVTGEHLLHVSPLAVPDVMHLPPLEQLTDFDGVRLFLDRARAVEPNFRINSNTCHAVVEICQRLDGLPLAIELVAARVRALSPREMLGRLEHRLSLASGRQRDVERRQRTLRDTIEWSYDLLAPEERILFRRLAVFIGGCTLEAVAAVCDIPSAQEGVALDGVESLIIKNLLVRDQRSDEATPRFRMLETIREYALERLHKTDEFAQIHKKHASFYCEIAKHAEEGLQGLQQAQWVSHLETELDNLRAALVWSRESDGDTEIGLRAAGALWWFWYLRGHLTEGRACLDDLLLLARDKNDISLSALTKAFNAAGSLAHNQGDYERASALYQEALDQWRDEGNKEGIALCLSNLASVARDQDHHKRAIELYKESLKISLSLNDAEGVATCLDGLGNIWDDRGYSRRATALYKRSLSLRSGLGSIQGTATSLTNLASIEVLYGDDDRAVDLCSQSLTLFRSLKDKNGMARALDIMGTAKRHKLDDDGALQFLNEGLSLRRELGDKWGVTSILTELANIARDQGDYSQAAELYCESLTIRQQLRDRWGICATLEEYAVLAFKSGQVIRGGRLSGAAEALREDIGIIQLPKERADYIDTIAVNVGSEHAELSQARVEGRKMSFDAVVQYALEGLC
jgi:predicted ATPase